MSGYLVAHTAIHDPERYGHPVASDGAVVPAQGFD